MNNNSNAIHVVNIKTIKLLEVYERIFTDLASKKCKITKEALEFLCNISSSIERTEKEMGKAVSFPALWKLYGEGRIGVFPAGGDGDGDSLEDHYLSFRKIPKFWAPLDVLEA